MARLRHHGFSSKAHRSLLKAAFMPALPQILARLDGSLLGLNCSPDAAGTSWEVSSRASRDGGVSWTPAETVLQLDPALGGWGGCQPVASDDCEIHVLLMCDAGTGVFGLPGQPREPKPLLERHLDVSHSRTDERGSRWREPVRIWQGYTGSINSAIQMQNGRLVLPFAQLTDRTWRARGEGLDAFWFAGTSETIVLTSDDGEAWRIHDAELKVQTPSIGTYGAVEPVVIERRPNDLWMLIRTQLGRFYESFSADGTQWTAPRPSALLSSDSPAGLVRLSDDRLVLLWNKCLRFPYAHGGRHVLHAAVSADHGHSWIGHREVARDPRNYEPPPPGGDHGTAYPFPVALPDDRVLITTGQGEGRILLIALDPDWLCETQRRSSFVVADAPKHDTPPSTEDDCLTTGRLSVARVSTWSISPSRKQTTRRCCSSADLTLSGRPAPFGITPLGDRAPIGSDFDLPRTVRGVVCCSPITSPFPSIRRTLTQPCSACSSSRRRRPYFRKVRSSTALEK